MYGAVLSFSAFYYAVNYLTFLLLYYVALTLKKCETSVVVKVYY